MSNNRNENKNHVSRKKLKKIFITTLLFFILLTLSGIMYLINNVILHRNLSFNTNNNPKSSKTKTKGITTDKHDMTDASKIALPKKYIFSEVLVSSVGDCTIGNDTKFSGETLPVVFQNNNNDYSYFFKNVIPYFKQDDITIANLETTFTNATEKSPKTFNFKAPPEFVKALTLGSIEGVNIANNHIYDYNQKGFLDTKDALKGANVNYFGEGSKWITTVKGQKFGFLGYMGWEESINFDKLKQDISELKKQNCTVIINFHWGIERQNYANEGQKKVAHFAIDNGADLIIGHHPHVIQGAEQYKGKFIFYSLANFCFGGNTNPKDKDSFILQTKFKFKNKELISTGVKVIPCSISSIKFKNDYCPTPSKGSEKERILKRLNNLSPKGSFTIKDDFYFLNKQK